MPPVPLPVGSDVSLLLDWASFKAADYACRHWHYSGSMPAGKTAKVGVWEDGRFIGVVVFSRGASPAIGKPYGLRQVEVCELTRVALNTHRAPVSRIIAVALRFLRRFSPGLRLVISYAASERGHHGGIYQAGNWIYEGAKASHVYVVKGKPMHPKSIHSRYGKGSQHIEWIKANLDPDAYVDRSVMRHKYLMPLDDDMRRQVEGLHQPYPKPMRAK